MSQDNQGYSAAGEVAQVITRRSRLERMWLDLKKAPLTAWFGIIVILTYAIVAIFAPWIAPYGETYSGFAADLPWGGENLLGTDQIGRDVLSRLIYGARNTIGVAIVTTLLSFVIGVGLGLVAAINRSWLDQIISRFVDVLMSIPSLIFALMLLSVFGQTIINLIIIIAILDSTRVFRLTRSVAVNVVVMDFVEAARLRGEGLGWIMRREILPNIMPPLVAEFGLRFCFVFLTIASLSFLGVSGMPTTSADWGMMVKEGANMFATTMQFLEYLDFNGATPGFRPLLAAGCIALLTVAVNFVVDWFLHKTSGLKDH